VTTLQRLGLPREDLEQSLDVDVWTVRYVDGGTLDGDIGFDMRGGGFDFQALMHYENSAWPTVSIRCP